MENIKGKKSPSHIKMWIARDSAIIPDDLEHYIERHPEKEIEYAKLHIFYDKPTLENYPFNCGPERAEYEWKGGRIMAEVPTYMFPEIKMQTCIELIGIISKNPWDYED